MAQKIFKVKLEPLEVQKLILDNMSEEMVSFDKYHLDGSKYLFIAVYERHYMRINSVVGLTIVCENTTGETVVKVISTGSSQGLLFLDFGAGKDFVDKIEGIISEYIK